MRAVLNRRRPIEPVRFSHYLSSAVIRAGMAEWLRTREAHPLGSDCNLLRYADA